MYIRVFSAKDFLPLRKRAWKNIKNIKQNLGSVGTKHRHLQDLIFSICVQGYIQFLNPRSGHVLDSEE